MYNPRSRQIVCEKLQAGIDERMNPYASLTGYNTATTKPYLRSRKLRCVAALISYPESCKGSNNVKKALAKTSQCLFTR